MDRPKKQRVLCVDDDRLVLEGLMLQLGRRYDVATAINGAEALDRLARTGSVAVIVSDMRMPGMNGAELLARARAVAPDTVRILLTGQADLDAALAAVNEGGIFRFLTKPCPPARLQEAIAAAAEQHRLVTAEKVLLEETLAGSVRTLTEVLSLASPAAFGKAGRLKRWATALCDELGLAERWHIELAAHLSQLGCISLPDAVAQRLHAGAELSPADRAMMDRVPELSHALLAHIPRLEPVRESILAQRRRYDGLDMPGQLAPQELPLGARILRLVSDLDELEAAGTPAVEAVTTLSKRPGVYDPELLAAMGRLLGREVRATVAREMPLGALRPGMVLAEDVRTTSGVLLIARGLAVTQGLLERLRNLPPGAIRDAVRVVDAGSDAPRAPTAS